MPCFSDSRRAYDSVPVLPSQVHTTTVHSAPQMAHEYRPQSDSCLVFTSRVYRRLETLRVRRMTKYGWLQYACAQCGDLRPVYVRFLQVTRNALHHRRLQCTLEARRGSEQHATESLWCSVMASTARIFPRISLSNGFNERYYHDAAKQIITHSAFM